FLSDCPDKLLFFMFKLVIFSGSSKLKSNSSTRLSSQEKFSNLVNLFKSNLTSLLVEQFRFVKFLQSSEFSSVILLFEQLSSFKLLKPFRFNVPSKPLLEISNLVTSSLPSSG